MVNKIVKKKHNYQDEFFAKLSFWFGVFSWIPLFNFGLSFAAVFFGIKAIKLQSKYPNKFSGKWYAIIGIVIGATIFISSLIFLVIYLIKRLDCSAVCAMI